MNNNKKGQQEGSVGKSTCTEPEDKFDSQNSHGGRENQLQQLCADRNTHAHSGPWTPPKGIKN